MTIFIKIKIIICLKINSLLTKKYKKCKYTNIANDRILYDTFNSIPSFKCFYMHFS